MFISKSTLVVLRNNCFFHMCWAEAMLCLNDLRHSKLEILDMNRHSIVFSNMVLKSEISSSYAIRKTLII